MPKGRIRGESDNLLKRHEYWLRTLYEGAIGEIPANERNGLSRAFLEYCSSLLSPLDNWDTDESLSARCIVHQYTTWALIRGHEYLFEKTWAWAIDFAAKCGNSSKRQVQFSTGFFDDLVEGDYRLQYPRDCELRTRILRFLQDPNLCWITFHAYDEDVDRIFNELGVFLEAGMLSGFEGPKTLGEIEKVVELYVRK